jgi:uncharacterized protein (DUF983 family)
VTSTSGREEFEEPGTECGRVEEAFEEGQGPHRAVEALVVVVVVVVVMMMMMMAMTTTTTTMIHIVHCRIMPFRIKEFLTKGRNVF